MKQEDAQLDANWGGSPSLIHHWMEALLRLAAMCLLNLACLLGMNPSRLPGECHTDATPQALPLEDRDPIKEATSAEAISHKLPIALMVVRSGPRSGRIDPVDQFEFRTCAQARRPSKHEGVFTTARDESSLAKARSAACQGSRFSKHRDAFSLSRIRAAAAHRDEDSCNLPWLSRTRISGHTAPS
jgi:hypothetical protein